MSLKIPAPENHPLARRAIFLFALSKNEPRLALQQKFFLSDPEGLTEREVYVYPPVMVVDKDKKSSPVENKIIEEFNIKYPIINIRNPFCMILVGKDGTEKLRTYEPVSLKRLYTLIDGMPMRIEEAKHAVKP